MVSMGKNILIACCTLFAAVSGSHQTTNEGTKIHFAYETYHAPRDSYELTNNDSEQSFTIHTEGCIIPNPKFLDPALKKEASYPINVRQCKGGQYPLLGSNVTHIWVITSHVEWYTIPRTANFRCCYKGLIISRSIERNGKVEYKSCIDFNDTIAVNDEYARVTCGYNEVTLYDQHFAFPIKKRFNVRREFPFENSEEISYNVLIMGLSSVSRLNFHRTMPATVELLKEKGAIEFKGYNTASEDPRTTTLIPALTGLSHAELKTLCWSKPFSTLDRCPFIWERYKDAGYFTALLEDSAKLSLFNVNHFTNPGFSYYPTDYYLYPFVQEAKSVRDENAYCIGSKFAFQVMLDYLIDLTTTLFPFRLFSMFWESSITYKDSNNPMLLDYSYKTVIEKLDKSGYLNKTILIVLSDHGSTNDSILKTNEGRLEQRLPILYILPPPSFATKYSFAYENLKENGDRLTTPYDLHDTLIDLLDADAINNEELAIRSRSLKKRGNSLFLQVPGNRTCKSANIVSSLCACFDTKRTIETNNEAQEASKYLLAHINGLISSHSVCAKLTLERIVQVMELSISYDRLRRNWRDFLVVVRTFPGGREFEATMRLYNNTIWSPTGDIVTHANIDHSDCMEEKLLKQYCYCIKSNKKILTTLHHR